MTELSTMRPKPVTPEDLADLRERHIPKPETRFRMHIGEAAHTRYPHDAAVIRQTEAALVRSNVILPSEAPEVAETPERDLIRRWHAATSAGDADLIEECYEEAGVMLGLGGGE